MEQPELYDPLEFEWDNGLILRSIEILMAVFLVFFLFWLALSGTSGSTEISTPAFFLMGTISFFGIFWAVDVVKEDNKLVESVGWGLNSTNFIWAWFSGVVFTILIFFLSGSYGGSILPFLPNVGAMVSVLGITINSVILWTILSAPSEELVWRGIGIPSVAKLMSSIFGNEQVGAIVGGGIGTFIFAFIFHLFSYGWAFPILLFLFINASVWYLGNNFFHSSAFGYGGHITLNMGVLYSQGLIPLWWLIVPSVLIAAIYLFVKTRGE